MASAVKSKLNHYLWGLIAVLASLGIWANHYFDGISVLVKASSALILIGFIVFLACNTEQGQSCWVILQGASVELKKIVWPNRKETFQTTGIVLLMIGLMGIFLWGLDSVLIRVVGFLMGHIGA